MYSFASDPETHPRMCAATHRGAFTRGERLNELVRRTIFIKPLLAVYWTQLLLVVKSKHGGWLESTMLGRTAEGSITRGEDVALHGAFLLSCEHLACRFEAAAKPGTDGETTLSELTVGLTDKQVPWYTSMMGCSNEPSVLKLVQTVSSIGDSLAAKFYERVATAMEASNFQSQSASLQTKLLVLFSKVHPSLGLMQLLINQVLPMPRLAVSRRCETLLSSMLDALASSSEPPSLATLVQLVDVCSGSMQADIKARFPTLSAAFERAGHPTIPVAASTRVVSIEELMAVPYVQWHQAYVVGACGKSGRKGRSDNAACKLLENIGPAEICPKHDADTVSIAAVQQWLGHAGRGCFSTCPPCCCQTFSIRARS